MYVPLLVLIAAGAVLLALLMLALRRRGSRDLLAPPQAAPLPRAWPAGAAPIGDVPPDLAAEVRELLAEDRKIEAIKIVRAATNLGLAEAKEMVERM